MTSSESLSQQEIDLLFGGAAVPEPAKPGSRASLDEIQIYDFRRPSRISKDRQRTLEGMYGLLTKTLESWFVGRVRSQVEVQLLAVEQFTFGEFLLSLTTPCNAFVFEIEGTGGQQGVVDFGRDLAFFLVDRLLGGNGRIVPLDRSLTPLERMVVRISAERVLGLISEIWQDHVPMDLSLVRFETVPDMLQMANREDLVLVANIEVSAEHFRSNILICLPFVVLEKFFTGPGQRRISIAPGSDFERESDRLAVERMVRATNVELSARFPSIPLTMQELADLRPGSLLATGIPVDSELELHVEGMPRFRGSAGKKGRSLAVRINGVIQTDPAPVGDGEGVEVGPMESGDGSTDGSTTSTDAGRDQ